MHACAAPRVAIVDVVQSVVEISLRVRIEDPDRPLCVLVVAGEAPCERKITGGAGHLVVPVSEHHLIVWPA